MVKQFYIIFVHRFRWWHTRYYLTAHSRSSWRAIYRPPSTSLLESPNRGSILGHIIFIIFIRSSLIIFKTINSTIKIVADDITIYYPITNHQDSNPLQEDMDALQRWDSDWLKHFHPQTCQTMQIINKRNIIQSTYTIHYHNLHTTDAAKYLGIHIHSNLNGNTHINKTAQRANITSAFLHRNIRTCPRKTKHLAYTTLVRPIIEYAIIIWDSHTASNIHKLETVQRRSARHIMHNYNIHASVTTILQYVHLPTLQQHRQHFKIIMLYTPTSQHINCHLHHTIHSVHSTLHTALIPHICIQNIFLPQHHHNMEQPTTCHNQQHNHTTT